MKFRKRDFVKHWFAGLGIVYRVSGRTASVAWESGHSGIAYVRDLKFVSRDGKPVAPGELPGRSEAAPSVVSLKGAPIGDGRHD